MAIFLRVQRRIAQARNRRAGWFPGRLQTNDDTLREEELRRRLDILTDALKEGRVNFAAHLAEGASRSLAAVRRDATGKVDLATVDGRVRALAMAVAVVKDRDDLKSAIPLKDIQHAYFEFIEDSFGHLYEEMIKGGSTPHRAAKALSSDPEFVKIATRALPEVVASLRDFWERALEPAHIHLEDFRGGKAVFGGDLFPSYDRNVASACGLYTDTIVLPDPFLRTAPMLSTLPPQRAAYFGAKHALNLLQYKSLALADLETPIVVVAPDRSSMDEDEQRVLFSIAEADAVKHAAALFGESFSSYEEVKKFAEPLDTPDKALGRVGAPERVLFDAEWDVGPAGQLQRALKEQSADRMAPNHAGKLLVLSAYGRMAQATDLLLRSQRLGGTPLIQAETSWKYFQWKLEYDAGSVEGASLTDLHIVRGLQSVADSEMQWLGAIPPDALLEIRKQGALPEIREILGKGVEAIANAKPNGFHRTADQIVENIQAAFDEHKKRLANLSDKKWRFAGKDIGSWVVVGTVGIAAAATGSPMYGLLAFAADQVLGAPKLSELPARFAKLRDEARSVKRSPVGLLFAARKNAR